MNCGCLASGDMRIVKANILACSAPQLWRALVVILVLVISVLQVIHITLLSRLEARRTRQERGRSLRNTPVEFDKYGIDEINEDRERMLERLDESNVLDVSGEYSIVKHLQTASRFLSLYHSKYPVRASPSRDSKGKRDVTLVTQSTVNHLSDLDSLASRWGGPVSLTVFAPDGDLRLTIETILALRNCDANVRHNVSFHLVYPVHSRTPTTVKDDIKPRGFLASDCSALPDRLRALSSKKNYAQDVIYPVNLLRNVARRNSWSSFVFVVDIDLQVNKDLHGHFLKFAKDNSLFSKADHHREAYVVPAFEIAERVDIPTDKANLLKLLKSNQVRPFYVELCHKCHKHTDYEAWVQAPVGEHLEALYQVTWKDPWEPFYIAHSSAPFYDERFRQYGFNRISQSCEMHIAGYTFTVLNNAFVVHRGLKESGGFHATKDLDLERNRLNFRQFKRELKEKYPSSPRRC